MREDDISSPLEDERWGRRLLCSSDRQENVFALRWLLSERPNDIIGLSLNARKLCIIHLELE